MSTTITDAELTEITGILWELVGREKARREDAARRKWQAIESAASGGSAQVTLPDAWADTIADADRNVRRCGRLAAALEERRGK